jgi:uncharacterized tellurite resistance protein B-like protein
MLDQLRSFFFDRDGAPAEGERHSDAELHQAAAALLVEAACMDSEFDDEERQTIERLLAARFEMSEAEARELVEVAEEKVANSVELFSFARTVKNRFSHEERVELLEMLWEVVYADGELHDYEANLMRRMTGLIHVTDQEGGQARKRALAKLGMDG